MTGFNCLGVFYDVAKEKAWYQIASNPVDHLKSLGVTLKRDLDAQLLAASTDSLEVSSTVTKAAQEARKRKAGAGLPKAPMPSRVIRPRRSNA